MDKTTLEALRKLWAAMDTLPNPPACENFPDAYYPEQYEKDAEHNTRLAKAACNQCPIKAECLDYGLRFEKFGIFGGAAPKTRQRMRRNLGITLHESDSPK